MLIEPAVTSPPGSLVSRIAAIHERHLRLLALELTAVVDELQNLCPQACADPLFSEAWDRFASAQGSTVRKALEEPALEAWIGHAQILIGSPALRTCPNQHAARALARFSALLMNLASLEENATDGRAAVLGSGSVPVLLGRAQLRPSSVRRTVVHWARQGCLHLREENGGTLVELGPEGRPSEVPGRGWKVDIAHPLEGVHVFAEPRCVQHPGAVSAPGFPECYVQAHDALPLSTRRLLSLSIRAAGPHCGLHPLEATSWLSLSAWPSPEELAHGLAGNLISRCARVYRFDTSSRLSDAMKAQAQEDLVQAVARELLMDEADVPESMLGRILAVCEARRPVPAPAAAPPESGLILDFRPVLTRAAVQVAETDLWTEPKTHQRDKAPGWRVLDALLSLSRDEIARFRTALSAWPEPEVRHFGLACIDYHEGQFPAGTAHLLACIEADRACEEYWLLLAFNSRHLRQFDVFDDITFGQSRTDALLERVRSFL